MTLPPRVSIVIPTYNRSSYVGEAIRSVLRQSFDDLELIVVDDGSTDNTSEVVIEYESDRRMSYHCQSNRGRSAARNFGLSQACGDYVGFLDSDDWLEPDALSAHFLAIAETPEVGMTIGGYAITNEAGDVLGERKPWESGGTLDLAGWLFDCYGMPGTVLHRRDWLLNTGAFDVTMHMAEDWELYLRLAAENCPMAWVNHVVCRYRRHEGNSDHQLDAHLHGSVTALEKLFARADLTVGVRALKSRAFAWANLYFGRKSLHHGELSFARARIDDALTIGWPRTATDRIEAAEFLLMPLHEPHLLPASQAISVVVDGLQLQRSELRKAVARLHMSNFFVAARQEDWQSAKRRLRDGVLSDPTWLANRGVLRLGLRALTH